METYSSKYGRGRGVRDPLTWTQPTEVSVGATSTTLAAADTTNPRLGIRLQNISDTAVDVSLDGTAATTTDGFYLAAGDYLELLDRDGDDCTKAFYAITHDGTSGKKVRVSTATG